MNQKTTITRRLEWDAAHRVLRHESKCATLHGHRYVALVTFTADALDSCGRVVDFSVVKEKLGGWIDENWDHTTIVNKDDVQLYVFCSTDNVERGKRRPFLINGEPTAENIADVLLQVAQLMLEEAHGIKVVSVEVFETPNCSALVRA